MSMNSAEQLHKLSTRNINNSVPTDMNLGLAEIEYALEQRAKGGMYNYFYYVTDSAEIVMLSNYFSSLGFELNYIPASSSAPYMGIMKISW